MTDLLEGNSPVLEDLERYRPGMNAQLAALRDALELVDYAMPREGLDVIVSHSMFHRGLVVGAWQPVDLASQLGQRWPLLSVRGHEPLAPRADLVPRDLGELLVLVAGFLEAFDHSLDPGDLVLSGSYTATAVPLQRGSSATADFGLLGSARIKVGA